MKLVTASLKPAPNLLVLRYWLVFYQGLKAKLSQVSNAGLARNLLRRPCQWGEAVLHSFECFSAALCQLHKFCLMSSFLLSALPPAYIHASSIQFSILSACLSNVLTRYGPPLRRC